jgi:hypothetical protein
LDARQLTTSGDVELQGCRIHGEVNLGGVQVGGQLDLTGAKFRNEGGTALTADGLRVDQDVFCGAEFEADGEVSFRGGLIGGQLDLSDAMFRNEGGTALQADGLHVNQTVFCRDGFEANGEVRLLGGHIGQLDMTGTLRNEGGMALSADGLQVDRSAFLRYPLEAIGKVVLNGATIGGQLVITGTFHNKDGMALNLERLRVDAGLFWCPARVVGEVSFMFGAVGIWVDTRPVLRIPAALHGLRYDGLLPVPPRVTAAQRIAWLGRDPTGYSPQPYSQLASVYRAEGHDRAARHVLVASQTRRHRQSAGWRGWGDRAWGGLLWTTVGYGYRPWLALLWLMALIVGGAFVVDALPYDEFKSGSGGPAFNSLLYTVDVLLPFVDLGYSKWTAVGVAQIVTVALIVLGWVLATAVIAALAGVLRRGD